MNLEDIDPDKYPNRKWLDYEGDLYLIAFQDLSVIHIFKTEGDYLHSLGAIDYYAIVEWSGSLNSEVCKVAAKTLQPQSQPSPDLANLKTRIDNCLTVAQELRDSESAATRDSKTGAVGRELSYAVVKLREAKMWVNEAIAIKENPNH